ncbi:E3 ubiquitin-protein ligase TRIM39-like isoform X2 [Boleophthalmus pectinirostris]|uniref:E3 ubiquitin-protein ligase TRIM39-like isoform X2 n=1 Tax=Boleophthalmus pectinirostris TaxID=150288 RepID=UPI00242D14C7|nr:E3 ubiquitin-protein ligase TRIM39-like isoform X2 [Boleophthalmus pectinirostris]
MGSAMALVDLSSLSCPVCLDLLTAPVTIPCGHSYCRSCVQRHWGQQSGPFSCPLCRRAYGRKPTLKPTFQLAALVDGVRQRTPPAAKRRERPRDLSCDVCEEKQETKRRRKKRRSSPDTVQEHDETQKRVSRVHILYNLELKQAELKKLHQQPHHIHRTARETLERVDESFSLLSLLLEKTRAQVKEQMYLYKKDQLRSIQENQERLQEEVSELKESLPELDPLDADDEEDLPTKAPKPSETNLDQSEAWSFCGHVTSSVSSLCLSLQSTLELFCPPEPEPVNRAGFLRCACDVSMEPTSAHAGLSLSADNRQVILRSPAPPPPDHPDRFTHYRQVLSREALSGRCYWEVERSGWGAVRVALCYRDIQRRGHVDTCAFGHNPESWSVDISDKGFSFCFKGKRVELAGPPASRLGVYLDHSAGLLSFYSVSHSMNLLHRLHTHFTQPLHVGVWFYWGYQGDSVYFPKLQNNPFIQMICV